MGLWGTPLTQRKAAPAELVRLAEEKAESWQSKRAEAAPGSKMAALVDLRAQKAREAAAAAVARTARRVAVAWMAKDAAEEAAVVRLWGTPLTQRKAAPAKLLAQRARWRCAREAAIAGVTRLAEEEAESRQSKRAEAASEPTWAEVARSVSAPSGADLPVHSSISRAATAGGAVEGVEAASADVAAADAVDAAVTRVKGALSAVSVVQPGLAAPAAAAGTALNTVAVAVKAVVTPEEQEAVAAGTALSTVAVAVQAVVTPEELEAFAKKQEAFQVAFFCRSPLPLRAGQGAFTAGAGRRASGSTQTEVKMRQNAAWAAWAAAVESKRAAAGALLEGQRAAAKEGSKGASRVGEGRVSASSSCSLCNPNHDLSELASPSSPPSPSSSSSSASTPRAFSSSPLSASPISASPPSSPPPAAPASPPFAAAALARLDFPPACIASSGPRASQASDGAEEHCIAEKEEREAAVVVPLDPPQVVSVPANEVLRALEAAGSDGGVGEGGFGKVFAVELPSLAARWGRVAVKSASGLHTADILEEVATLRLCHHRNVLPLLGYCDDARAPCMITPLMHGGSLDDRLLLSDGALERLHRLGFKGDTFLGWQQRLLALCDAARGLAHLHGARILHRDVKTANILLDAALRPLPMANGGTLLVYGAVLSDVGLAKVREPTLGDGGTTHATTRNLAFSMGFGDPALLNSSHHSEKTDAFGIGICILMSLVSEPAAGLMNDHEDDVCEAMEDGTGELFGTAHAIAGWPSDTTRALAALVHGLSMATKRRRQPLPEALAQMEVLLGVAGEVAGGGKPMKQPAPAVVGAAATVSRPLASSSRGAASMPAVRGGERPVSDARAAALAQPEAWVGGELTRMVRQLEVGDADASLARKRERVTKAYDSMMVRLERVYAAQGHAPLPAHEEELRKIDLLAPRHLGRLNGLAHTLRKWWNAAKHRRDQWPHPPSDKEVQRLVREVIAELDGLGW